MAQQDIETRIQRLEDTEEIKKLMWNYTYWLDYGELEKVLDCFADNAVIDIKMRGGEEAGEAPLEGVYEGKEMIEGFYNMVVPPTDRFAVAQGSQTLPQVLIVEDDSTWLEFLERRLQSPHYNIHTTRRTGEALELMQRNRYALVLLDWRMPGVGGPGVLDAAQETNRAIPIIVLSAFGGTAQRARARQLGARAFIDKPHDESGWEVLKQKVLEILLWTRKQNMMVITPKKSPMSLAANIGSLPSFIHKAMSSTQDKFE